MENNKEKYKEAAKYLLTHKVFIAIIILVTVLGFGFTITNHSIGTDDISFERYYVKNQILTAGRYGMWAIGKVLTLTEFAPFWGDLMATLVIVANAVMWCIFFKKQFQDKFNIVPYLIFASVFISYPLVNEAFIYQNSNIGVMLCNMLMSFVAIILYENFFNKKSKKNYLIALLISIFAIGIYESCIQTFLVSMGILSIINMYLNKDFKEKAVLKFIFVNIIFLITLVTMNLIIVKLMYVCGIQETDWAAKEIYWKKLWTGDATIHLINNTKDFYLRLKAYFPVKVFVICSAIGFLISIMQSIKRKDSLIFLIYLGMLISNFAIAIIQFAEVMLRMCQSWSLFTAFVILAAYLVLHKNAMLKNVAIAAVILLVIYQTRELNQMFYNDYIRYQRDLNLSLQLIEDLRESYDISKPLVIVGLAEAGLGKSGSQSNSFSLREWSINAFEGKGIEYINFLNSLRYCRFRIPTEEQYEQGKEQIPNMEKFPKDGYIKEFGDYIVVNLSR